MGVVEEYLLGPLYALLPRRWRERMHRGSAELLGRVPLVSGVLEFLAAMVVMRARYMSFFGMLAEKYVHYVYTIRRKPSRKQDSLPSCLPH